MLIVCLGISTFAVGLSFCKVAGVDPFSRAILSKLSPGLIVYGTTGPSVVVSWPNFAHLIKRYPTPARMFMRGSAPAICTVRPDFRLGGMIRDPPSCPPSSAFKPGSPEFPICIGRDFQAALDGPPLSVQSMALTVFQSSGL